ncbi:hypothetical protein EJB05_36091, partial [Eragrostis curvula]
MEQLPAYREATMVFLGDGRTTSFWLDLWDGNQPLAFDYPALFSHSVRPNISVAAVFNLGPNLALRNRLTTAAQLELDALSIRLSAVTLDTQASDIRKLRSSNAPFTSRGAYLLRFAATPLDPFAPSIWESFAPSRCKIFLWLLHRDRLRTKAFLHGHGWQESDACPHCALPETSSHLFLYCPKASQFWCSIGLLHGGSDQVDCVQQLWEVAAAVWGTQHVKCRNTVLTAALWTIWKTRNAKVFEGRSTTVMQMRRQCANDITLWSSRSSKATLSQSLKGWGDALSLNM